MNKNKEINLKATLLIISGVGVINYLRHGWGISIFLSLLLGFIFIIFLWIGVAWTIRKTFGE